MTKTSRRKRTIHKLGIVNRRGGNNFVPNDTATRSEVS
ncbi:S-layer homology domain-containing protein [Paenibacillus sp. L3-i20]